MGQWDSFDEDLFGQLQPGSFDGISIPVLTIEITSGTRAAFHTYPHRPGRDIELMGRDPVDGIITAAYFNGLDGEGGSNDLWPGALNLLRERAQEQRLGPLVIPTLGTLPKAMIKVHEVYKPEARDGAFVQIQFFEDSAELFSGLASRVARGSVQASATSADNNLAALQMQAFQSLKDSSGNTVPDFTTAISNFLGRLDQFESDLAAPIRQADTIVRRVDELLTTVTGLKDPSNWQAVDALRQLKADTQDTLADAAGSQQYKSFTTAAPTNIGAVAVATKNTVAELMRLNLLPDPNDIDAGEVLLVIRR